jgi:hypothetical protein
MSTRGYPVVVEQSARKLGELYQKELGTLPARSLAEHPTATTYVTRRGALDFDDEMLDELAHQFNIDRRGLASGDQKEIFVNYARYLIDQFPLEVIQDLDFWRYVSLFPFRNYVIFASQDFSPSRYGGNGDVRVERWPVIEGLRWAYRLGSPGNPEDEYLTKLSTAHVAAGHSGKVRDMVISSVVRPKWAKPSKAARAFMDAAIFEEAIFDEGNTGEKRHLTVGFQGRVARLANNLLFESLDQEELTEVFIQAR